MTRMVSSSGSRMTAYRSGSAMQDDSPLVPSASCAKPGSTRTSTSRPAASAIPPPIVPARKTCFSPACACAHRSAMRSKPPSTAKRHEDVIAGFDRSHAGADLFDDARELVAERHSDPRVGDETVIEVEVGSANARARDPHDGIFGMQNLRHRFAIDADPMRSAIVHREHGRCSGRTVFVAARTVMVPLYPATHALVRATGKIGRAHV